jgi:hypothetical protein
MGVWPYLGCHSTGALHGIVPRLLLNFTKFQQTHPSDSEKDLAYALLSFSNVQHTAELYGLKSRNLLI